MEKRITREDVAKEANVSVAAVSRALNNSGYVKKDKKEHIIQVANRMGYNPNPIALSLQGKRTHQLLFLQEELTGAYNNQMFHGMVREAQKSNYRVILWQEYDFEKYNFEKVKEYMFDGIIFPTHWIAEEYSEKVGRTYHIPTVTVSYNSGIKYAKPMPCILVDNYKIVNEALFYLEKKGHKKIGIAVPSEANNAQERLFCWKEYMSFKYSDGFMQNAILVNKCIEKRERDLDYFQNDFDGFIYYDLFETGREAAREYAKRKCKATAVICFDDDLAQGMIQEMEELGYRVPEDVSIIGINGVFSRNHFSKKLTTVSIYPDRVGAMCVRTLIDVLEERTYKYINYGKINILEGDTVRTIN